MKSLTRKPVYALRFSTRGALIGFFLSLIGYVIVGLNAPWFVTVITVVLSLRWEYRSTDEPEASVHPRSTPS